ncbi:MAG: outer membrane beta-barrel protein [Pseudomonadota bacterium]|nr:outer membrane beta-barrel protein [Pseudomonadota bacterium]
MTFRRLVSAMAAAAAISCFATTSPAEAGGPATYKPAASAPAGRTIWEGFHVGGHIGWTDADHDITAFGAPPIVTGFGDDDSFSGGFLYGSSWQFNRWVLGTDSVWSFGDFDSSVGTTAGGLTATSEVNYTSESRARVGLLVRPNVLLFGALGFALADVDLTGTAVAGGSDDETLFGITYGLGLEFAFNNRWFGRIEYAHTDYDDENFNAVGGGVYRVDLDTDSVRGALGYRFDWSPLDLLRR